MKATIIIVGEKKEKFLKETIQSCLRQNYKKIEIILVYSYLKNINYLKDLYFKNIIFKHVIKRNKNPVLDQINKIKEAIKVCSGEYIFLLDGDDLFKVDKVAKVISLNKKKNLCLDDYVVYKNKKYLYLNYKKFKKNILYKFFFNPWPDKICTSCISGPKHLFDNFFLNNKIINSKYLAIDVLLIIFYLDKIQILKQILTVKKESLISVDKKYSNKLSEIYWARRIEQHKYLKKKNKINYKFEYYMCLVLKFLFRNFK